MESTQTEEQKYYASDNVSSAYDKLWGSGNIHCGYFPHIEDEDAEVLTFEQAGEQVTKKMVEEASINAASRVLDLGCGFGKPLLDVCIQTKCVGVGLDLSPENIKKCNQRCSQIKEVKASFVQGSFFDINQKFSEIEPFTHMFSQYAFCHVHSQISELLAQIFKLLPKGGILVNLDYLGPADGSEPSAETRKYCYDRLNFQKLIGHEAYKAELKKAGFEIVKYYELDAHGAFGYGLLVEGAKKMKAMKNNNEPLYKDYEYTALAMNSKKVGQCLFVARKPL